MDDLRAFGMPEAEIAKARAEAEKAWGRVSDAFVVHPDNVRPLKLLIAMASQWRHTAMSTATKAIVIRTGLDYGPLREVADMEGLGPIDADVFRRLRVLEAEALNAWREDREAAQ